MQNTILAVFWKLDHSCLGLPVATGGGDLGPDPLCPRPFITIILQIFMALGTVVLYNGILCMIDFPHVM